jgi:hypothetical protein
MDTGGWDHVASLENRNAYRVWVMKTEEKTPPRRTRPKRENNIKMDLNEI